jgi:O-antigen ligase
LLLGVYLLNYDWVARAIWAVLVACLLLRRPRLGGPLDAPLLVFVLSQAVSLLWAADLDAALHYFTLTMVPLAGVFLATTAVVQSRERFADALTLLAVGLLAVTGYGVYQQFTSAPRVVSYVGNPNILAMALNLAIPLLAGSARQEELPWSLRFLLALVVGLSGLVVLYTLGRGGWLAFAAAWLLLARQLRAKELAAALGAVILAAPLVTPSVALRSAQSTVALAALDAEAFTSGRLAVWTAALRMIGAHPLLGVGYGNFESNYLRYMVEWPSMRMAHAHNLLLNLWAETGLFGVAAFGWLAWTSLQTGRRLLRATGGTPWHGPAVGILAALLGFFVHNLVSDGLPSPATAIGLALNLGLLQVVWALNRSIARSTPSEITVATASAARSSAWSTSGRSSLAKGERT